MTRIIAGKARGARLAVPAAGTRPTSDRVRESLFGALASFDAFAGARVLDLYAGSGALGLESLSRGAASADLVEHGRAAASVVRRNAAIVA
ncbi:16S rRNA (guanine(966)-N(2))-methyltransferase RsmD, partial [Pseudomonas sp. BGM005]|nr:16S rRNA (guanine(966)-N(2))-methyltransferase RsmD [Pseudomonas sp. BG5]